MLPPVQYSNPDCTNQPNDQTIHGEKEGRKEGREGGRKEGRKEGREGTEMVGIDLEAMASNLIAMASILL